MLCFRIGNIALTDLWRLPHRYRLQNPNAFVSKASEEIIGRKANYILRSRLVLTGIEHRTTTTFLQPVKPSLLTHRYATAQPMSLRE